MAKKCANCAVEKESSEYYANKSMPDGYAHICKECQKIRMRDRYQRLKQDEAWLDKERERCRNKSALYGNKYYNTEASNTAKSLWRKRNKMKVNAHTKLYRAIRSGLVSKAPCKFCGANKVQGHHGDYSKPLEVWWLCSPCHKSYHRGVFLSF